MDRELEIAGAASLGGWLSWKKHHTLPVGTPCPSCATPLAGPYCHECGQLGEQFNRSLGHLISEAVESFFHVDGRLFHTLPRLILKPAELTRDYIEGRRAWQIPPLRMFLVVMLIFFFVGGLKGEHNNIRVGTPEDFNSGVAIGQALKDPDAARALQIQPDAARKLEQARAKRGESSAVGAWIKPRLEYAAAHPHEFTLIFEAWTHRIAIAMLPVAAAILSLLFLLRRPRFYVYDHLIFSMHSLSFMGLLGSLNGLVDLIPVVGDFSGVLFLAAPVHLFVHMRGVYGVGVVGALWRMLVLFLLSATALGALLAGVALLGLSEMRMDAPGKPAGAVAHTATLS